MRYRLALLLTILTISTSACAGRGDIQAPLFAQAWVDAPLDNSMIPLAPYSVVFHAAAEAQGLTEFELLVNGQVEAVVPVMDSNAEAAGLTTLWYGEYLWDPPAAGTYLLEIQPLLNNAPAGSPAQAKVTVGSRVEEIRITDTPTISATSSPTVTLTPTLTATLTPTPTPTDLGLLPSFDTALFYYGGACQPQQITVRMRVGDSQPTSVVLFYRLRDMASETRTEWEAVAMNPIGDDLYERIVASSSIPDANMFPSAYFQAQVVATNQAGESVLRTEVAANQVTLLACGGASRPPVPPTAILPQCSDGIDNDGDGLIDYGVSSGAVAIYDPQCSSPDDDDESN